MPTATFLDVFGAERLKPRYATRPERECDVRTLALAFGNARRIPTALRGAWTMSWSDFRVIRAAAGPGLHDDLTRRARRGEIVFRRDGDAWRLEVAGARFVVHEPRLKATGCGDEVATVVTARSFDGPIAEDGDGFESRHAPDHEAEPGSCVMVLGGRTAWEPARDALAAMAAMAGRDRYALCVDEYGPPVWTTGGSADELGEHEAAVLAHATAALLPSTLSGTTGQWLDVRTPASATLAAAARRGAPDALRAWLVGTRASGRVMAAFGTSTDGMGRSAGGP